MAGRVITADRDAAASEETIEHRSVRISPAAEAAIAVRPIPMEAARAGAMVAASIAIEQAESTSAQRGPTRINPRREARSEGAA